MPRLLRTFSPLALLALALAVDCQAGMRIAHLMVEGEGIARDMDQLQRAVDHDPPGAG